MLQQLGIGQFGPLYDAEVELQVNVKSRALIKVLSSNCGALKLIVMVMFYLKAILITILIESKVH